jgi:hypothetical protein
MATERWADPAVVDALADFPCTQCLSDKELLLILAIALCLILSTEPEADCVLRNLENVGGCENCYSDRQILEILVKEIIGYGVDNGYITNYEQIKQELACMACAPEKTIRMGIAAVIRRGITDGTLFNRSRQ